MIKERTYSPFPGLQPYSYGNSPVFSGRDRQKLQLLKLLAESNFIAIVGATGVGKTSFINSKVVPDLLSGYSVKGKNTWKIVSFRPGKNPLGNFATALSQACLDQKEEGARVDPNLSDKFEQTLRERNYAAIELVEQHKLTQKDNLLIYIDHIDDLLLYAKSSSDSINRDIKTFIKRLLEVANQSAYSIHIVATIRIEQVAHFTQFPEFSELINKNQFLLSDFDANDLAELFAKITKNHAIHFDHGLIKYVVDFYKNNPPLFLGEFQHAMKLTYEHWKAKGARGPVTLEHLKAVGGLKATIEHQLDNIYGYMSTEDKKTCRLMFPALIEFAGSEVYIVPRTIQEVAEMTGRTEEQIIAVAGMFANETCGVIIKSNPQDITGRLELLDNAFADTEELITKHTLITLVHDFILEEWPRLHKWIKEEQFNATVYKEIAKDAERNDPPYEGEKLLATWKWYQEVQPHYGWAKRYNKNFALTEDFILKSKGRADREIARREAEELSREQSTRRNRSIKVIFSLIALILTVFAFVKTRQASEAALMANEQQTIAKSAEIQAQKAKEDAAFEKQTAELSILQASKDRELAQKALDSAEFATERARQARLEALEAQNKAQQLRLEADKLTRAVSVKNRELSKAEQKIEASRIKEDYLKILESVRESSDETLKILGRANNAQQRQEAAKLAANAYREFQKIFEPQYKGISDTTQENTQNKLFSALTLAYQKVGGSQQLNKIFYGSTISKNASLGKKAESGEFIIGTNDTGAPIYRVIIEGGAVQRANVIASADIPEKKIMGIRNLSYSKSAQSFLVSHLPIDQKNRYLSKYDFNGNYLGSKEVPNLIRNIFPYKENDFVIVDQQGDIYLVDGSSANIKTTPVFSAKDELMATGFHEKSNQIYLALSNKVVVTLSLKDNAATEQSRTTFGDVESEISAIRFIQSKNWLVLGTRKGGIYIYDASTKELVYRSLSEHSGTINCIELNENESLMGTGGRDKILNIWNMDELHSHISSQAAANEKYQPTEFEETESVRDVAFLNEDWILVLYSTEGLSSGKGGAFLLPIDFDKAGRELQKIVK